MYRLTSALLAPLQVSCSFYEFAPYILGREFLFRQHTQVTLGVFFHLRQLLFPLIHIDDWHDYENRFLSALYKVLTDKPDLDEDLLELVRCNDEDFAPFYGEEGWRSFIDGNLLNDYVDADYLPVIKTKGYTWWRGGYVNKQRYFAEANRYIDESTRIIHNRGKRMLNILKEGLCQ